MHLAQLNVARMRAPLDSERMSEFREFLAPINALAERQPGFIWRLSDAEGGDATSLETPFPDDMVIVNLSVWREEASLRAFVYGTVHSYFVRERRRWFERMHTPHVAMWWVSPGTVPSLLDAKSRLDSVIEHGPTPRAFTLARGFGPDGSPRVGVAKQTASLDSRRGHAADR